MGLFNEILPMAYCFLVTHEEDIAAYAHGVIRLRDGSLKATTPT